MFGGLIDGLKLYRASAYQHEPHIRLGSSTPKTLWEFGKLTNPKLDSAGFSLSISGGQKDHEHVTHPQVELLASPTSFWWLGSGRAGVPGRRGAAVPIVLEVSPEGLRCEEREC